MERKITNDVVTEIGLTQRNKILTLEGDVAVYDLRGMKKEFPNITTLKIKNGVIDIRISNRTFPNIRKVISESPLFETNETMLIRTSKLKSEKGILLNAFCKSEEEALYFKNVAVIADMALDGCDTKKVFNTKHLTCINKDGLSGSAFDLNKAHPGSGPIMFGDCLIGVKNPRLKSRASDSPSGFFSLATRLHLPFYLLSCFICPMHLPSGRVLLRLSVSILTLPVLLRCRLFKWTFTTAPTLPRGTVALLSGYFRFRSVCLYATGFTRCWVNSYF